MNSRSSTRRPRALPLNHHCFYSKIMYSEVNEHISTASERLSPIGAHALGAEAVLAARVHSVKALWTPQVIRPSPALPRTPSPPQLSRKIRARRRQPRRLTALAPPPPAYCLEVPAQLFCDPSCKVSIYKMYI